MTTKRTLLVAGALSALVLSAPLALALVPPLIITNLTGRVRILQGVPCGGVVDVTTTIAGGRMELTPAQSRTGVPGLITLSRLDLFLTPFSVQHECLGISATAEFREVGASLVGAVSFPGEPAGAPGDGLVRFSIPKEQVLIYQSVLDNAPVTQPETRYTRPSEDVTGLLDVRRGTAQLHIVLASRLRFRAGCVRNRCVIDEEQDGTQTVDVAGIVLPPGTDTDGDGTPDLTDNCPLVANPTQARILTPVLTPPPDVTLQSCQDRTIGTAQAIDVCHGRPVQITNNAPARFAIGPNLVTWSGNDGIDPIVTATQTVTVAAMDRTPPTLACTAVQPPGGSFQVGAADDCDGRITLRLGSFVLAEGEVIKIQEIGRPGVRLLGTVGPDKIRHFQVGKGEAIIRATDAAGNVASAVCK